MLDRKDMTDSQEYTVQRIATRRKFIKLCIFAVFLIYPFVSKIVLGMYVCENIAGTRYLVEDFSISCDSQKWKTYAYINPVVVLFWPVGVPLGFLLVLVRNRARLKSPTFRLQMGFIYDAYTAESWWFEMFDMVNKLFMTSLLTFFPVNVRMQFAMAWTAGFAIVLLVNKPYLRKGDDRLHLLAQCELFLLVLAAYTLHVSGELPESLGTLLSILLIFLVLGFVIYFLLQMVSVLNRTFKAFKRARLKKFMDDESDDDEDSNMSEDPGSLDTPAPPPEPDEQPAPPTK
jgi:hypothetical protein